MKRDILDYFVIRNSGLFDSKYYLEIYPDVRRADIDPIWHYVRYGWKEGRNPSREFDGSGYFGAYPDVKNANINPLVHYQKYGKKEGRKKQLDEQANNPKASHRQTIVANQTKPQILLRKSIAYLRIYGYRKLVQKATTYLFPTKNLYIHPKQVATPLLELSIAPPTVSSRFESKVSIIIPTKDAGDDLRILLKMYKTQKGFREIEMVIVDSGSTDNTVKIAEEYNSKVISIMPEEFSHSYARNIGAESATGDYLLFTVQDALPPTDTWLYELMAVLIENKVKAVSCAEYPRESADLFYRAISWNHYKFLGVNERDRIYQLPESENYITLRQNGQLSDLACLIQNDVFKKYKYRLNYAEDLDLGIRLIKDGEKIAFLGSIRIIHSHNRAPYYFLKRGYVDNLFLSELFTDYPIPMIKITELVHDVIFTFHFITNDIYNKLSKLNFPVSTIVFTEFMREIFISAKDQKYPTQLNLDNNLYLGNGYLEFLGQLIYLYGFPKDGTRYNGFLIEALNNYSNIIFQYLNQTYEHIDNDLAEDIKLCLCKELSQLTGAHLAYGYHNSNKQEKQEFDHFHKTLKAGI